MCDLDPTKKWFWGKILDLANTFISSIGNRCDYVTYFLEALQTVYIYFKHIIAFHDWEQTSTLVWVVRSSLNIEEMEKEC